MKFNDFVNKLKNENYKILHNGKKTIISKDNLSITVNTDEDVDYKDFIDKYQRKAKANEDLVVNEANLPEVDCENAYATETCALKDLVSKNDIDEEMVDVDNIGRIRNCENGERKTNTDKYSSLRKNVNDSDSTLYRNFIDLDGDSKLQNDNLLDNKLDELEGTMPRYDDISSSFGIGNQDLYPSMLNRRSQQSGSMLDPDHPIFGYRKERSKEREINVPPLARFDQISPDTKRKEKKKKKGNDPNPDHFFPDNSSDDIL